MEDTKIAVNTKPETETLATGGLASSSKTRADLQTCSSSQSCSLGQTCKTRPDDSSLDLASKDCNDVGKLQYFTACPSSWL